jgi:hypothetical protein
VADIAVKEEEMQAMTAILNRPVSDRSAWTGPDIQRDPSAWEVRLGEAERGELLGGLAALKARDVPLTAQRRADFPVGPALKRLVDDIVMAVKSGLGFKVLRGLPIAGLAEDDVRLMYFGLAQQLGTCVSQDPQCALVADVKEKGLVTGGNVRAYGSKHPTHLHVDLSDVTGLLGVRQAPSGALSTLASSTRVYNEFVRQHPDWLEAASKGFYWDRFGEQKEWESPVSPSRIPLFSVSEGGQVSCRYNRGWIGNAAVRRNQPFTEQETAILDFFDEMAQKHALTLAMSPGDAYFANNYTMLHGRHAYEETPDAPIEQRRLFMRVWVNIPDVREFAEGSNVRFGLSEHGNIGWTGQELIEGRNLSAGHRRSFLETQDGSRG